jgi:pilus assembly protein CpaE
MTVKTIQVKIEVKDLNLREDLQDIVRSIKGFDVKRPDDTSRADLLISELGDEAEKDFQLIQSLLDSDAVGEVFLTSPYSDPTILLRAMRTGAKEFLTQPIKEEEVRQALKRFKETKEKSKSRMPAEMGQIIELIGSKGGVGTTTVAVNLAVSLAEMEGVESVVLVDLNMVFGEVPLFLEMNPNYDWGEITKNISRLDATFLMNILSKHPSGVYVLPSPACLNGNERPTPQIMKPLLGLMKRMFDFVVIDGGQSLDETGLELLKTSDIVLLVSNLSLPCLANTKRLLNSFYYLGYPSKEHIKVVINRYMNKSEVSLKDAEVGIGNKIFWTIPNDYETTLTAINYGKPLPELASKAMVTTKVRQLAGVLANREEKPKKRTWKFLRRN